MPEEVNEAKPKKSYIVHTTGGESLTIPAHGISIDRTEDRIYFLDETDNQIEKWVVFLSGVALIEIKVPQSIKQGRILSA